MNSDGSILSELLFSFMHLANEVNESLPGFWHSLLWPIRELKLPDGPRLTILVNMQENGKKKKDKWLTQNDPCLPHQLERVYE